MALLVHMQATQPISEYERSRLARVAENMARLQPVKARLAALQSQQAPQLADGGAATGSNAGRSGNKGKKHPRGQENNTQVPFVAIMTQYLLCLVQAILDLLQGNAGSVQCPDAAKCMQ